MSITNDERGGAKRNSPMSMVIVFLAINCIIVSVLTFTLTALAVLTNNYDKWFPVAILLSVGLFFIGRLLLSKRIRKQLSITWYNKK
ncbi:hypothetical protein KJ365_11135 [Glaciecola sp. XM2]|jgi:hypothetical protein|uniref:hypothetical protein n=1 Tax=Glaciecola sp. XM2 TaxID=1914931 RepID=UPI001BDE70C6|nr:hypothetical protein [Glaciecola sp. XM2]MBT1451432.1 hypothetical protein [Glaciecola sp. XM2]